MCLRQDLLVTILFMFPSITPPCALLGFWLAVHKSLLTNGVCPILRDVCQSAHQVHDTMMAGWHQLADSRSNSGLESGDCGSECGVDDTQSIGVGSELSGLEIAEWAGSCSLRSRVGVSPV